jgi:ectoine hydroxylase
VFSLLARHPRLVEPLRSGSAKMSMFISSSSRPRRPPKAMCGNGIRIRALGHVTTACPSRGQLNIAVFLDAVMAINGPLFLIRKSHRADVLNAGHDKLTTSYPL